MNQNLRKPGINSTRDMNNIRLYKSKVFLNGLDVF
jgi:hypothetical protein